MCLDCGCGKLNESHGDPRHITLDTVRSAAKASGVSENEAMDNIASGLQQVRGSSSQGAQQSTASASAD